MKIAVAIPDFAGRQYEILTGAGTAYHFWCWFLALLGLLVLTILKWLKQRWQ